MTDQRKPIRFNWEETCAAADAWGFNCGPGALCAALDKTPSEIRPHLCDFADKGYTNPTLMTRILGGMGVSWKQVLRSDVPADPNSILFKPSGVFGDDVQWLVRVQWGGPWTKPGVPMRARYRQTHWVAVRAIPFAMEIFDVNAVKEGGWLPSKIWKEKLVPWLIKECVPKGDGSWWFTHVLEIETPSGK